MKLKTRGPRLTCRLLLHRCLPLAVLALSFALLVGTPPSSIAQNAAPALPAVAIKKIDGSVGSSAVQLLDTHLRQSGAVRTVAQPNGAYTVEIELEAGNQMVGRLMTPGPKSKKLFEQKYNRSDLDHDVRQLCDDIVLAITKKPGIATGQIAFVSTKNGSREIYICNYEGKNVRQITRDGHNNINPALSPLGKKLIHTTFAPGFADLLRVDLINPKPTPLARQAGAKTEAVFSQDGERVAYTLTVNNNADLYTIDANGGKPKKLIASPAHEATASWSPNGKEIVYSSNGAGSPQLYVISSKGGKPKRLNTGQADCRKPCWSPDGRSIAFVSGGNKPAVTLYDMAAQRSRVISAGDDPSWGADSRHFVFAYSGSLYRCDSYTGKSVAIVSGMGTVTDPSWTR